MGKISRTISLLLILTLLAPTSARCEGGRRPSEYDVKAAYIYNFAKFVEWPQLVNDRNDTIHVCVLGDDPFGPSLSAIDGKAAGGRRIGVRLLNSSREVKGCEMLFIAGSEGENLEGIIATIGNAPILTISDSRGFTQRGVMINFFVELNRVCFEINPQTALRAGLKISSNLLRLARIVQGP